MSTSFEPTLGSLFGIPPVESHLSALARVLLEANRKPRNRSEWEARFSFWQKPASETEEAQIATAATRVRRAMRHSRDLAQRSWTLIEQGSYHNNTNTRTESDMDLCVCLTDAFFVEGPTWDSLQWRSWDVSRSLFRSINIGRTSPGVCSRSSESGR